MEYELTDVDDTLDHAIVSKIERIDEDLVVSLLYPICRVHIAGTPRAAFEYAYVSVQLVLQSISAIANTSFATGSNVPLNVWNGEDVLSHIFLDNALQMDCLTHRLTVSYTSRVLTNGGRIIP